MIEQTSNIIFQAKLKSQILKQIFKDLDPKNLKGVDYFFAVLSQESVNLQFISSAKDILITIILKKNLFQHYVFNKQNHSLHRYSLDDFTVIWSMFENNKIILDLQIDENQFEVTYTGTNGKTRFVGMGLLSDQDDQQFLIQQAKIRPQSQDCMMITISKVGILDNILSYAKGCKLNSLWFRYNSVSQRLQVTDKKQREQIKWLIKVEDVRRNSFNSQLQFHFKMLNCAINLLNKESALIMTFYSNFILLDALQKEKTFTIKLNAKQDLIQ